MVNCFCLVEFSIMCLFGSLKVNIVNFCIHLLFKTLKRSNSQTHSKKIRQSCNIFMNNINFHFLAPSYLKNRGGAQNVPKKYPHK